MATMIPSDGGIFNPASGEEKIFNALKQLPEDYYVFHSYRVVELVPEIGLNENEIDFFIFNPNYGCLFLECKNGNVEKTESGWQYVKNDNGVRSVIPMKDPFDQAFTGQHNLFNKLRERYPEYRHLINNCKFMVAVWFPKLTKAEIAATDYGPNVVKEIILSKEAVICPQETVAQIQALMERMKRVHIVYEYTEKIIDDAAGYEHSLTHEDAMKLYSKVLCPTFRAVMHLEKDFEQTYKLLIEEQYIVLEYLTHQRTAAISGASGTGKTMVALERARRLSINGQKVLFLCYNRNLKDWLECAHKSSSEFNNVDFFTLDAFACKKCNVSFDEVNYYDLKAILEEKILANTFEYPHIIIDEGQDFGAERINETEILELFCQYGEGQFDQENTSFFIFYDKNQLVNSLKVPTYITNVDSKITLYQNCRNTKNIANVAYSLIDTQPILSKKAWNGETPIIIGYRGEDEFLKKIDNIINQLSQDNNSRVIISCSKSLQYSAINKALRNSKYKTEAGIKTNVYTSATFKGLEADDVIIIDAAKEIFEDNNCSFYVAASRARKRLYILMNLDQVEELDFAGILKKYWNKTARSDGEKLKQLSASMHCYCK